MVSHSTSSTLVSSPLLSSLRFNVARQCVSRWNKILRFLNAYDSLPLFPLTVFRRSLPSYQRCSREPAEADFLSCLFKHAHATLQVAEMSSDTAPLRAFRNHDWPCLRELVLRGGPRRSSRAYLVESLTRMPNLRILKLELAQRSGAGLQRICPPGWTGGCPWPNREVLTVSNPHPDDELYEHLPDSLQELTIRCFPRHYIATERDREGAFMGNFGWEPSLPTSADMLQILRRCGTSLHRLRHLDIEFEESGEDVQLLRHIAATFPTLAFLQFHRYHKSPENRARTSWVSIMEEVPLFFADSMLGSSTSGSPLHLCRTYDFSGSISTWNARTTKEKPQKRFPR